MNAKKHKMEILLCTKCRTYTLEQTHCDQASIPPRPPKFSVEDKYEGLKRKAKEMSHKERGLI